jgi:hypothetical protein
MLAKLEVRRTAVRGISQTGFWIALADFGLRASISSAWDGRTAAQESQETKNREEDV